MENRKITADDIVEWEIQSLGDAIGNCLELNNEFIGRYCGERVAAQLRRIPETERENILSRHLGEGRAVYGFASLSADSILLPVGEVCYQFEGAPKDTFADPNEVYISGDCAYVTLDGAEFPVDVESLTEEIDEFLSGDCPDEFVVAYLECALWSSCQYDENGNCGRPLDDDFSVDDISRETRDAAAADCADFWRRHGYLMAENPERAGYDFWLTRNGHGAGFWDGRWPDDAGEILTAAAKAYGGVDLYVGDDGRIHG